jgi:hypothetical protein
MRGGAGEGVGKGNRAKKATSGVCRPWLDWVSCIIRGLLWGHSGAAAIGQAPVGAQLACSGVSVGGPLGALEPSSLKEPGTKRRQLRRRSAQEAQRTWSVEDGGGDAPYQAPLRRRLWPESVARPPPAR